MQSASDTPIAHIAAVCQTLPPQSHPLQRSLVPAAHAIARPGATSQIAPSGDESATDTVPRERSASYPLGGRRQRAIEPITPAEKSEAHARVDVDRRASSLLDGVEGHSEDSAYRLLRRLAASLLEGNSMANALQPTAVVHAAFLKLSASGVQPKDETALVSAAANAIRHVIVDHARAAARLKRGRGWKRVALDSAVLEFPSPAIDAIELHEALVQLEAEDERAARVVELRYFGSLTTAHTADVLGVSLPTVERDWRFARAWLADRLSDRRRS